MSEARKTTAAGPLRSSEEVQILSKKVEACDYRMCSESGRFSFIIRIEGLVEEVSGRNMRKEWLLVSIYSVIVVIIEHSCSRWDVPHHHHANTTFISTACLRNYCRVA
jgi:hypothetical protein